MSIARAAEAVRPQQLSPDPLAIALAAATLTAWAVFALAPPARLAWLCGPALTPTAWLAAVRLELAVAGLGKPALAWLLMVCAMMPPMLFEPLRHLRARSFADGRFVAYALFAVGYGVCWAAAGPLLAFLSYPLRTAPGGGLLAFAVAAVWQATPGRQRSLNACHRRPPIAAFGLAAARSALGYGFSQGAWSLGSCWALMLWAMAAGGGHVAAMALATLLAFAERLEPPRRPAWHWRAPLTLPRWLRHHLGYGARTAGKRLSAGP